MHLNILGTNDRRKSLSLILTNYLDLNTTVSDIVINDLVLFLHKSVY